MNAANQAVAIVVVSWNTRELLERCLNSMGADVEAGRAEVLVVDNGSRDGSPQLVRERFRWARLIENGRNLGFGAAVNLGAAQAVGPWLAASNADIELEPGALEALLAAARARPRAGAVVPRLVMPDGATQHSVHSFPSLRLALAFNLGAAAVVPGLGDRLCLDRYWDPERERDVDWAHGAFMLLRRAAFESAGGFDAGQWMYAEDLDLCWRLRRTGWDTRYAPAARVRHEVGAAAQKAFGETRTPRHMAAAHDWMTRRRGARRAVAYAAINAVAARARAAALAAPARALPARYRTRRERELHYAWLHGAAAARGVGALTRGGTRGR